MCYNIAFLTKRQEIYEKRYGASLEIEKPEATYHISGFAHPHVPVISCEEPQKIQMMEWGLIPKWIKSEAEATKIQNQTLNARSETVFEKPSFKHSIQSQRCVVIVDAFFEHQQKGKAKIPWMINDKEKQPMALAGIFSSWLNPQKPQSSTNTFSILTTRANAWMSIIHNVTTDPRMPIILLPEEVSSWLKAEEKHTIESFFKPYPEDGLTGHTVGKLSGKEYKGNVPGVWEKVHYGDLGSSNTLSLNL